MELRDLLLVVVSSVQISAVLTLAGLAWMYKRQVGKMVDATRYQAFASKEHVEATTKLMERLDAHTTTSTHMSMMMSKGVDATLELAKANQRFVRKLQGQTDEDFPLSERVTEGHNKSGDNRKLVDPRDVRPSTGDIIRVPRRTTTEKAKETHPVVS